MIDAMTFRLKEDQVAEPKLPRMDFLSGTKLQSTGTRQRDRQSPFVHAHHKTGAIDAPHRYAGSPIPDSRPSIDFSDEGALNRARAITVTRVDGKTRIVVRRVKNRFWLDNGKMAGLSRMYLFPRL